MDTKSSVLTHHLASSKPKTEDQIEDQTEDQIKDQADDQMNDAPPSTSFPKKVILAGVVGNVIEWYDFALFGYFTPVIAALFFPDTSRVLALLETYGVFAAGFVMRPLGAIVFGFIGDRIGRRRELFLSVILMAIPTFLLGLLPEYNQIGILAPISLIGLRLIQGFSVGGEFSGSVTYVGETAPLQRRGLSTSFTNVGSVAGMLMGSLLAALVTNQLSESSLHSWGWRLPFLFGGIIGFVALYIRSQLPESAVFQESQHHRQISFLEGIQKTWRVLIQSIGFASGYGVIFYLSLVYLPTYIEEFTDVSLAHALRVNTVATALLLVIVPIAGWISDRWVRRKPLLLAAMTSLACLSYPCFLMALQGIDTFIWLGQLILVIPVGFILGTAPALLVELFPTEIRLTEYSIAYNLGLGLVGGTAPLVSTWLIDQTNHTIAPVFYLLGMLALSILAVSFMVDRSRNPLISLADQSKANSLE